MLIPFQMALPKFARSLYLLLLLLRPLPKLKLLSPLRPPLLPISLNPLGLGTKPPPNSPSNLSSPYKGGRILPNMFPWSKFGRLFLKIRLPLLL
jgi:hypothetical protein